MPFKTIEGHSPLFDRKKDFDDMFADPRIAEMVDGLLDFSEE